MSLTVPLAVRLKTSRTDRIITKDVRDISYRSVVPGGFASIQLSVASNRLQLSQDPDEIDYYGRVIVYDQRTGRTLCEGRIEDLGRTSDTSGQVWELSAIGSSVHTEDITRPYIVVDRQNVSWKQSSINKPYAAWQTTNDDNDPGGGLIVHIARGTDLAVSDIDVADMLYQQISYAGQKVARVRVQWDIGFTDSAWVLQVITKTGPSGTKVVAASQTASPAGGSLVGKLTTDGGSIVNGNNCVTFRARHNGVPNVIPDDLCWFEYDDWYVRTLLLDRTGAEITTGYSTGTVTADQVVADLLGRSLPKYDGTNASITTNSYLIDQLAYYDGVTPRKVLDDLMALEAACYWAAWESNAAGLNRFEWTVWPTNVAYEADVDRDIFQSPSTAADLYNAVRVRYHHTSGTIKMLQRTTTVLQLTNAGLTREGFIDLGDQVGSTANATQAGDQFLIDHSIPSNAGHITIARPITDLVLGRQVMPWELVPGKLIRVRGVRPTVDTLNPVGRNGVTIFRVKSVEFHASSGAADLELDTYTLSTARALAARLRAPKKRQR